MRQKSTINPISTLPTVGTPLLWKNIQRLDILPVSAYQVIELFKPRFSTPLEIKLFQSWVAAGFPSPADDYLDCDLDLNEYLVENRLSTYYLRVRGDSMQGCGIFNNALIIVDRSVEAVDNDIVLAIIDGEFTCKRLRYRDKRAYLCPENPDYPEIPITEENNFRVWGVIACAVNDFRRRKKHPGISKE